MPFDFAAVTAPFRMQPGLRRLAAQAQQLTPNRLGDAALREKLAVLSAHAARALVVSAEFDPAPALRTLAAQAAAEHPQAFAADGLRDWHAPNLGWSLRGDVLEGQVAGDGTAEIGDCLRALPARWRAPALISLAVAEDFAVIDGASGVIPWLAVCLPSHWAPEDTVGRHFAEVHAPVADNTLLLSAADHLARLVSGPERWERFVWTLTPNAALNRHPSLAVAGGWAAEGDDDALAATAFFRTERQTFIPVTGLPAGRRQAIFTIRVEVEPMATALAAPAHAAAVHDALASMGDAVLAYRGLTVARDRLLAWLARQSTTIDATRPR